MATTPAEAAAIAAGTKSPDAAFKSADADLPTDPIAQAIAAATGSLEESGTMFGDADADADASSGDDPAAEGDTGDADASGEADATLEGEGEDDQDDDAEGEGEGEGDGADVDDINDQAADDDSADDDDAADADEGEGDDDALPEGFVELEMPEALREHVPSIEVPEEVADVMRALTNSYESRVVREERETDLASREADIEANLLDFREFVLTDPFALLTEVFGTDNDAALKQVTSWLLQDEERLSTHLNLLDRVQSDEQARENLLTAADLFRQKQGDKARRAAALATKARQTGKEIRERVDAVLTKIRPEEREFVQEQLNRDLQDLFRASVERNGNDLIDPKEIDRIGGRWITKFGITGEPELNGDTPAAKKKDDAGKAASAAREQFRKKLKVRDTAKKTVRPTGPPRIKSGVPKKGAKLDDVLGDIRSGKTSLTPE